MRKRDTSRDTAPGAPVVPEAGPEPEPAPARPDGYRYERPRIDDSMSMRLLGGLQAERFPRATTVSETDGQLAAHYQAGPRTLPAAAEVRPPEPSVLLACTSMDELPAALRERRRVQQATIFIPRKPSRPTWLVIVVCGAIAVACLGLLTLALVQMQARGRSAEERAVPAAAAVAGATASSPPVMLPPIESAAVATAATATTAAATASGATVVAPRVSVPKSHPAARATAVVPHSSKIDGEE